MIMLRSSFRLLAGNVLKTRFNQPRFFQTSTALDKIVSFHLSDIGEGIREVVIKEWFVKEGDTVEQFENICEVQSDKASVTITSRYDGKITKLYHKVDDIALVGKPLADFDVLDDEVADEETSSSDSDVERQEAIVHPLKTKVLATPAVRRVAMENKVDLSKVRPTGRNGRVLKGDVLEYLNMIPEGTQKPHPTLIQSTIPKPCPPAPPVFTPTGERIEPLKGIGRAMVKSMTEALRIPHFAYCDEVEMSKLMEAREQLKEEALSLGVKLTFMPFMIKAASLALLKYPILNSSFDEANMSIIYKPYHNVSVAIASPQGLVVPNIKNVQEKSILQVAQDLNGLQERGKNGRLTPDDFANGTFSLSNIGIIGGTYTKPVIMPPQVAIGAMGKARPVPRFGPNDEIIKANIMQVSWSADHRIIDGVTMAEFSNLWKKYLENPNFFLLAAK